MAETKTEAQLLSEKLVFEKKSAWELISDNEKVLMNNLNSDYVNFLNKAKTERESCTELLKMIEKAGFQNLDTINRKLTAGDKVYQVNRNKTLIAAIIGEEPIEKGINAVGAHIDSPRIDLKQNPVYEEAGLAMLKTHYYGGIKKYQWTALPLAMHGVILKEDGKKVEIVIGEDESDPVFCISDLLPHLAKDQMQKKMSEAIEGESLNIIIGNEPIKDEKVKEKIKLNLLRILNEKYGIKEKDFLTAEIELVPAIKAREVGLDRSLVGGYGQDDRVCAFTAIKAIMEISKPKRTAICVLADKEEIGSIGNTGMQSRAFENFIAELIEAKQGYNGINLIRALKNSKMISADVNAGVDPSYEGVMEKRNSAFIGGGVSLTKYTGSGGKYSANDAHAEFVSEIRQLFDKEKVIWQIGELGKVDQGGGGTIAGYLANLGMDVIDCGVALLSMHSPYEIASKVDIYMAYKAYKVFLNC